MTDDADIFTLLNSESVRKDPYPLYARYRAENRVLDTGMGVWFLFGHRECEQMLRDRELSVDERNAFMPGAGDELPTLIHLDPPDHDRLRRLVQTAFTPKRVEGIRDRVVELVVERLDSWSEGDEVDLIAEFAYPVPLAIICELLGIDEGEPRRRVQEWSTFMARSIDPSVLRSPELNEQIQSAEAEFIEEMRSVIARRRVHPETDLLSQLVILEADGDRLSEDELLGLAVLLLVAGHETTVNLIGNAMNALLNDRRQFDAVVAGAHPDRGLIDEMLRFDSPVQMTTRIAMRPVTLGDITIPKGNIIVLMLGAANRDPDVFVNPDQIDPTRGPGHLAFGFGIHHCLGAALARAEGEVAITQLIRRFPNLTLIEEASLRQAFVLRGRERMRVRL